MCEGVGGAGGGKGGGGGGALVSLKLTVVSTRKGNLTMSVLLTRRELANRDLTKQQECVCVCVCVCVSECV